MARLRGIGMGCGLLALMVSLSHAGGQPPYFSALVDTLPGDPRANVLRFPVQTNSVAPRFLIAGDSWARYMWDDGSHNDIFDKFGHGDKLALSLSLANDPGPGYAGPEYSVGGSEARQWVDTANYPWIANVVAALQANPDLETVMLSIGGNDLLAGRSDGGWYKDMDLDVPGSEAALLQSVQEDLQTIIDAFLDVRPNIQVLLSSYDYPNFNVGFLCFVSACPMRRNLSRDLDNDLVTDAELNAMLVVHEATKVELANANERVHYDHSVGLLHHYFGDGVSPPGVLPHPGQEPPLYEPFPGGNPLLPTPRALFRRPNGLDVDPIHLSEEGYRYKITNQMQAYAWPRFRGEVTETFFSQGGDQDGWTDGTQVGTEAISVGDNGVVPLYGIVSFDTAAIPDGATVLRATLYLQRASLIGTNPFSSGALGVVRVDVMQGSYGAPAVEALDAFEVASAPDCGSVIGSAFADGYALRIDMSSAGLAAIHDRGLTQFRLSFPNASSGAEPDFVQFHQGDASQPPNTGLPTLADVIGTAAPFLDVRYDPPTDVSLDELTQAIALLHPNVPNPFRTSTALRFTLRTPEVVKLSIFDVAGRHVATLLEGNAGAGQHVVHWDGRNGRGARVGSGIYLARLVSGERASSRRILLLGP